MASVLGYTIGGLALLALVLKLAFRLPKVPHGPERPTPQRPSALADHLGVLTRQHVDLTGLHLLPEAMDAFAMRVALARSAQRTIDAQYYIWDGDLSGRMLLSELIAAADRGVRVRLLIDDNPTKGLDGMWATVSAHSSVEVRLFNPLAIRRPRALNYLFDFPRLNRRMHNKSMTVDDVATIVGGRNIGDHYFGAESHGLFIDLDALAIGKVVPDVAEEFQEYWTSDCAYPAEGLLRRPEPGGLAAIRTPEFENKELAEAYREATEQAIEKLEPAYLEGELVTWAPVRLVSDNPIKALNKAKRSDLLASQIAPSILKASRRFDLISAYFVPSGPGSRMLAGLTQRGVRVQVVTNSVQVSDVPLVHSGYAPYRRRLLRAGIKLFEARPLSENGGRARRRGSTRFSGGGESLHAKTFTIDNQVLFVGSFNFDPRSALLNCEMGFLIDSPSLTEAFTEALDKELPETAYAVSLGPGGRLRWESRVDDEVKIFSTEPGTTVVKRAMLWFLSKLPIEWAL
ncbi:MAG: phospholipase D family protein [Acidobacteria bacterium]|nr:phospholipase D family protein [Acidobacteriota bacterium]